MSEPRGGGGGGGGCLENQDNETSRSDGTIVILKIGHYLWRGVTPKRKGLGKQILSE